MVVGSNNSMAAQPTRCPNCQTTIPRATEAGFIPTRASGRRVVLLGLLVIAILVAILVLVAVISHRAHEARLGPVSVGPAPRVHFTTQIGEPHAICPSCCSTRT